MNDILNLHGMINKKYFNNFFGLKIFFNELEQFYSSSSSEKLFFQVRQNDRVFFELAALFDSI